MIVKFAPSVQNGRREEGIIHFVFALKHKRLKQALSRRRKRHIVDGSRLQSAVLVPIFQKEGQYHVLLTQRTDKVKEHKGEISFPGGACEEADGTLVNTALRESAEEIGLAVKAVEVLGRLDDAVSRTSNYIISPFVGLIPWPYRFKMNGDETAEIIEVPLPVLLNGGSLHKEKEIIDGEEMTSYSYHYQGKIIWGATARILHQFLDIFSSLQ